MEMNFEKESWGEKNVLRGRIIRSAEIALSFINQKHDFCTLYFTDIFTTDDEKV